MQQHQVGTLIKWTWAAENPGGIAIEVSVDIPRWQQQYPQQILGHWLLRARAVCISNAEVRGMYSKQRIGIEGGGLE